MNDLFLMIITENEAATYSLTGIDECYENVAQV